MASTGGRLSTGTHPASFGYALDRLERAALEFGVLSLLAVLCGWCPFDLFERYANTRHYRQ